jgi:beta-lactam-binding protein with PASTA domain
LVESYKGTQVTYSPEIGYSGIVGGTEIVSFDIESPSERDAWVVYTGKNSSQQEEDFLPQIEGYGWGEYAAVLPGAEKQFVQPIRLRKGISKINFYNGRNPVAPILVNVIVVFVEPMVVPDVVGKVEAAAKTAITGAGLAVGTITTATSETVAAGNVISQNPTAGVLAVKGSAVALVISLGKTPEEKVNVPNVVGKTEAAAKDVITGAGLATGRVNTEYSETVAAGNVVSQNPTSGTSVSKGSSVTLVISLGMPKVNVPNVVGKTQSEASSAITGLGLAGKITTATNSTVAAGNVISQNPVAGTSVDKGSVVALVVSLGPPLVSVPNVVNKTQAAASTAITDAGLKVGTITTAASSTVASGSVISQNPTAGTSVATGSSVNMVIATQPLVSVPNVVNKTQAAASTAITGAGLKVGTITTATSSTVAAGSVISQNPAAGTSVTAGSSVSLVIATQPLVSVPNVVNKTQAAASTAITDAGLKWERSPRRPAPPWQPGT